VGNGNGPGRRIFYVPYRSFAGKVNIEAIPMNRAIEGIQIGKLQANVLEARMFANHTVV